ncbi:MAG: MATE family efflux transporter, partial [Eubacteriales bacterium]
YNILKFAFPLLLGNLFQQLYNMVDTWVIGQRGDNGAYAAVGSVGPIINILIGFFLGLSSGAGVIISQYYGAKNEKKVHDVVHTAITMTLILAAAFTVIGIIGTPFMLELMLRSNESAETIYPPAKMYLTIYFAGVSGLMIYNICSGILRAVGDSNRPFFFLVVSALINIVLDILFVFVFNMGVAGVALATVIAQLVSSALSVITLLRSRSCIHLSLKELKIDFSILKKIFAVGIPAAIQMAITSFSNVFVQSYIANVNADKTLALAGWTTYTKMDQFIFLPIQSISLALTTFVGQNLGNGDEKRAKRGTRTAYLMASISTVCIITVIMVFAPQLSSLFKNDPGVIHYATILIRYITPFYMCCCVNQIFSSALRGAGNTRTPMIIMLCSFVVFRQIYLFIMSNFISNDLIPIAMGYPAGWLVCCISTLVYYRIFGFRHGNIVSASERSADKT